MFLVHKKLRPSKVRLEKKLGAIIEIAHVKVPAMETLEILWQHQKTDKMNIIWDIKIYEVKQ